MENILNDENCYFIIMNISLISHTTTKKISFDEAFQYKISNNDCIN